MIPVTRAKQLEIKIRNKRNKPSLFVVENTAKIIRVCLCIETKKLNVCTRPSKPGPKPTQLWPSPGGSADLENVPMPICKPLASSDAENGNAIESELNEGK